MTSRQTFNLTQPNDGVTIQSSAARFNVSYDAATNSYTIQTVPAGEAARMQTFAPADIDPAASNSQFAVYAKPGGNGTNGPINDRLTLTKAGTTGLLLYSYVGGGLWTRTDNGMSRGNSTTDAFVYGFATADSAVPRTGSGTYLVDLYGRVFTRAQNGTLSGLADLTANFGTGGLGLNGTGQVDGAFFSLTGSGAISSTGNAIAGDLSIAVTGGGLLNPFRGTYTGPFSGHFFGPAAEEVGATFRASGGGSNGVTSHAIGWFLGRPFDSTSATLQQLTSLRKLNGVSASLDWRRTSTGQTILGAGQAGTGSAPYAYPSGDAYLVNGISYVPGDRVAAESDARMTTFRVAQGTTIHTLRAYRPGPTNDQLVLSYVSLLDLLRERPTGCPNCETEYLASSIAYGLRTDPAAIPLSGTASYSGLVFGRGVAAGANLSYTMTGTASFVANFGSDQLTGTLSPVLTNTASAYSFSMGNLVLSAGVIARMGPIDSGTNALIAGTLSGAGTGNYSAAFFGPGAVELGGAFTARNIANPESAGSPVTVSGGMLAKRN